MSHSDDWDEVDEVEGRRDRFGEDYDIRVRRGEGQRSAAVTAIGVVTIIVGSLGLLMGLCMVFGVLIAGSARGVMMAGNDGGAVAVGFILAFGILLWSLGLLVGGIGVLSRGAWARMLTLVLSGFGLAFGVACLVIAVIALTSSRGPRGAAEGAVVGFVFFVFMALLLLGHGIWAFIALLGARAKSEFR